MREGALEPGSMFPELDVPVLGDMLLGQLLPPLLSLRVVQYIQGVRETVLATQVPHLGEPRGGVRGRRG